MNDHLAYTMDKDGVKYGLFKFPKVGELHAVPLETVNDHNFTTECYCEPEVVSLGNGRRLITHPNVEKKSSA